MRSRCCRGIFHSVLKNILTVTVYLHLLLLATQEEEKRREEPSQEREGSGKDLNEGRRVTSDTLAQWQAQVQDRRVSSRNTTSTYANHDRDPERWHWVYRYFFIISTGCLWVKIVLQKYIWAENAVGCLFFVCIPCCEGFCLDGNEHLKTPTSQHSLCPSAALSQDESPFDQSGREQGAPKKRLKKLIQRVLRRENTATRKVSWLVGNPKLYHLDGIYRKPIS